MRSCDTIHALAHTRKSGITSKHEEGQAGSGGNSMRRRWAPPTVLQHNHSTLLCKAFETPPVFFILMFDSRARRYRASLCMVVCVG